MRLHSNLSNLVIAAAGALAVTGATGVACGQLDLVTHTTFLAEPPRTGFGASVAAEGATLMVGAMGEDGVTGPRNGGVRFFERNGQDWTPTQSFSGRDFGADGLLGYCVAISGDNAVAGAPEADPESPLFRGAAAIFRREGGVWTNVALLSPPVEDGPAYFGASVAAEGDMIAVGAPLAGPGGGVTHGAVFVYVRDGASWVMVQRIDPPGFAISTYFGFDVAISGDRMAIGAPLAGASAEGAVHILELNGGSWQTVKTIPAPDADDQGIFGARLSLDGEQLLVGEMWDDAVAPSGGAAHLYEHDGGAWTLAKTFAPESIDAPDAFGHDVVLKGDLAIVVAEDFEATADGGGKVTAMHVFHRNFGGPGVWGQVAEIQGDQQNFYTHVNAGAALAGEALFFGRNRYAQETQVFSSRVEIFDTSSMSFINLLGDCNGNGVPDGADLMVNQTAYDVNRNGVLDECEGLAAPCAADLNGDGQVSAGDLASLLGAWGVCP